MIHILFVPGSFGSALEWGVRTYSQQYESLLNAVILDDGSWHSFKKMCHVIKKQDLLKLDRATDPSTISTVCYPQPDCDSKYIFDYINEKFSNDKVVIVTIPNMQSAELVLLMRYDKIIKGLYMGLDAFGNDANTMKQWNKNYTNWQDMKRWEYREWFSACCSSWMQEWLDSQQLVNPSWLTVSVSDVLDDFLGTVKKIIAWTNLEYRHIETPLLAKWLDKQQKNVNLLNLINEIVHNTVNKINFSWPPLHIVAEALVQKKLQEQGYQIRCYELDEFPTDSLSLNALLEK
jgi:hypothetical protein